MPRAPIVIATDYSEAASAAARVAARLAERPEDVLLVHATPAGNPPAPVGSAGLGIVTVPAEMYAQPLTDQRLVEEQLTRWRDEVGLIGARTRIVHGPPGTAVARVAREEGAALIVAGATGASGIERVLLGSVATAILHDAPCDVIIVRGDPARDPGVVQPFGRILVGLDLQDASFEARAAEVLQPIVAAGGEVVLAHVRDRTIRGYVLEPDEAHRLLAERNEQLFAGRARTKFVEQGKPADELGRLAREERADLIVVGDHHPSMLERLLMGSVTKDVTNDAVCSVLVIKDEA